MDGKTPTTATPLKTARTAIPVWPTPIRRLNQGSHPGHIAWDVDARLGDPVFAVVDGWIERLVQNEPSGYGNLVIMRTATGEQIYYGHNSRFLVHPGDRVRAGQVIALAGSTGHSTGPHVHLEVRDPSGHQIDPGVFFGATWRQITTSITGAAASIAGKSAGYQVVRPVSTVPVQSMRRALAQPSRPIVSTVRTPAVQTTQAATSAAVDRTLLQTPIGNVTVPAFQPRAWANVGAVAAGGILGIVGLIMLAKPVAEKAQPIVERTAALASKAAILAA